jgi:hypothetical protein
MQDVRALLGWHARRIADQGGEVEVRRGFGRPSWESGLGVTAILVMSFGALLTQAECRAAEQLVSIANTSLRITSRMTEIRITSPVSY